MTGEFNQLINHWRVGNVKVTRIVEMEGVCPPFAMFGNLTEDRVKSIGWLHPHYASPGGLIRYSVHGYVVESQGKRIIVDTCGGNDKARRQEQWNKLQLPFLERLTEAGYPAESIDMVLCTHLHLERVGWNTRWDGSKWVPTFPNASYLVGRLELEHYYREEQGLDDIFDFETELAVMKDSIFPVHEAGLLEFVETNHRLTNEVALVPTPGHTPGHVSVVISSAGKKATITGDVMHNPIQIADPEICANFDFDKKENLAARRAFIDSHVDRDVLVLGSHFTTPSAGHIVRETDGLRFVPVEG